MVNCYGWRSIQSTPRDDSANGAHTMQGSTETWSCIASELHISYMICVAFLKIEYFSDVKFFSLYWYTKEQLWRMTP